MLKLFRRIIGGMIISAAFTLSLLAKPVLAITINEQSPNMLFDNFTDFTYGTPGYLDFVSFDFNFNFLSTNPVWWVTLNNGPYRFYNIPCSTYTKLDGSVIGTNTECLTHEGSGGGSYMRFSLKPNPTWQQFDYNDIALTDTNDGFSYHLPKRWLPQVGQPVTLTARMRWGENYKADGTGGFLGSSGIYLWNMPADYTEGRLHGPKAIGFDLLPTATPGVDERMQGLAIAAITVAEPPAGQFPVYYEEEVDRTPILPNLNINDWNEYRMVWSVDEAGVQTAKFWVNDQVVGEKVLREPLPALSIEAWNDNYVVFPGTNGAFMNVGMGQITQVQNLDVAAIRVFQHP